MPASRRMSVGNPSRRLEYGRHVIAQAHRVGRGASVEDAVPFASLGDQPGVQQQLQVVAERGLSHVEHPAQFEYPEGVLGQRT